jgi:hypothetical protein
MRIRSSSSCLILLLCALTSACASKSGGYDRYASDPSQAQPPMEAGAAPAQLPGVEGLQANLDDTSHGAASAVLASPAPAGGEADTADVVSGETPDELAPDTLETMGADSIEQMLIFTGQLAIEVEHGDMAERIDAAVQLAVGAGGYVAQMTDTTLHLRVPSKNFRRVMTQIEDLGELRSRQVQALDVSEEYNDLEVRLANLRATRARIEKLLGQSKELAQILTIEKELERVTAEIDRIEGRMRLLSSRAAFSTIAIGFSERPEPRVLEIAEDTPPLTPPKTLRSSARWVHEVNIHGLLSID